MAKEFVLTFSICNQFRFSSSLLLATSKSSKMSSNAEVLAEIARLSCTFTLSPSLLLLLLGRLSSVFGGVSISHKTAAIDQHKQYSSSSAPVTRGRGRGRGRGTSYRGRGRGGTTSQTQTQTHKNATWVAPHLPPPSSSSRSGTTTPTTTAATTTTNQEQRTELVHPKPSREVTIGGVVFVADSRGNKLVRKTGELHYTHTCRNLTERGFPILFLLFSE